ncbi:hypothetical protein SCHPADRAFT_267875 [Schizopora paradoxa]|uniref:Uncharacterized protein n=1 Tax=Schizopora paradoxa TaxID=27342 RepID=A0A0H2RUM8_9AGAM|nr:hypothetical protein SCHPADRAFT_267875 [Schizopora paradoxa]
MVTDSVKYYSFMIMMYIISYATLISDVDGCTFCELDVGISNGLGIVTMVSLLPGIIAPKLLINIRKAYYTDVEPGQGASAPNARRTVTWQVAAPPTGRAENLGRSFEMSSQNLDEEYHDILVVDSGAGHNLASRTTEIDDPGPNVSGHSRVSPGS